MKALRIDYENASIMARALYEARSRNIADSTGSYSFEVRGPYLFLIQFTMCPTGVRFR